MVNTPEEERFRNEGKIFAGRFKQIVTRTDSELVFENKKKSIFIRQLDEEEFRDFEPEEFELVGYLLEGIESGEFMQIDPE